MAAAASTPLGTPASSSVASLLPYDNEHFNDKMLSIIQSEKTTKFTQLGTSLRRINDFSQLQYSFPRTIEGFQKALKSLPLATQQDTAPVGVDSTGTISHLRSVVFFIILINNNRRSDVVTNDTYCLRFNKQLNSVLFDPDDIEFSVAAWNTVINDLHNDLRKNQVFSSFPDFVNHKKLKNMENYPICNESQIVCSGDSEFPLTASRMLNPGTWVNSSSLLCLSSASHNCAQNPRVPSNVDRTAMHHFLDDEIIDKLRFDITNFIGGESGSGKTTAAVLAGGRNGVTLYYVPRDGYGVDIDQPYNESAAKLKFVSWVASSLGLKSPSFLRSDGELPRIAFAGDSAVDASTISVPWRNNSHDTKVLLVLDELGNFENVRRAFCRLWPKVFRQWLARLLCLKDVKQLYFVIVGTGVENFEKAPGSLPSTYQVFTVRAPKLFAELLAGSNDESCEMKQLSHVMLELLYKKSDTPPPYGSSPMQEYDPHPTCPATYRFLQLVSNPRCASLAIDYMRTIAARRLPSTKNWTSRSVRSSLPDLSFEVATQFGRMNGLSKYEDQKIGLIGSALYCVLSKATTFTEPQRKVLSVMTGLLADTGFLMRETDFNELEKKPESNPFVRVSPITMPSRDPMRQSGEDVAEEQYVYVFRRGTARFRMSKAHVALLLLSEGSICGQDVVVAADWKIFEAATADYIMLCWILNVPAPQKETFPIYRRNRIFFNPCYPEHSYSLDVAHTPSNVYRGILQFGLSDTTMKMKEKERVTWLDNLKTNWTKLIREGGGMIFENGGGAAFADVIAVFRHRIIVVQCKYKTKSLTVDETQEACDTLIVNNLLTLEWMAECAGADKGSASCHLVVVLAAGFPQTLHADTNIHFVDRGMSAKNGLPSHFNHEKLRVEVTVAFPSDNAANQTSCLFPVLQYPYDDQAAMETAIEVNCDGGLMSKHAVLGSPTMICNQVLAAQ